MKIDIAHLAKRIDAACAKNNVAELNALADECEKALDHATPTERVLLFFFRANAHDGIRQSHEKDDGAFRWNWEQPNGFHATHDLRRALVEPGFAESPTIRRCQIHTNLGNSLSAIGRPVEAIEQWSRALALSPKFAMALGNRGYGIFSFAGALYDPGHRQILAALACRDLLAAIAPGSLWDSGEHPDAEAFFKRCADHIATGLNIDDILSDFEGRATNGLGRSKREQRYRRWALEERLFLNPLNDAGHWPIAAHDVLHLPSHTYRLEGEPRFVRYYDILKSEYVAARLLCFEGIEPSDGFADNGVLRFETFDGGLYTVRVEKLKAALRLAYSLFDKIALFLNDYFSLGHKASGVAFRHIFYDPSKPKKRFLAPAFSNTKNWPLRGLFALSKDLFDPSFKEVVAPDAARIDDLRNAAEHRFLALLDYGRSFTGNGTLTLEPVDDFERKVVHILKLARAALTYLSLAVGRAEAQKQSGEKGIYMPIPSIPYRKRAHFGSRLRLSKS